MEWQLALLIILGSLLVLMASGLPVAFCFLLINVVGVFFLWGGEVGLEQLIRSIHGSVTSFTLIALPLFILMGEVMFQSGISIRMMDALDKWLGRLPGRLSLLAVGGGTLFATLSGSGMASVAMLGATLVPEMEKRGYKKAMTVGPILGSSGLAIMIPPSNLGVIAAVIGLFSVGKLLIAIVVPGLMMAVLYATYIIIRSRLQPHLAPIYEVPSIPILNKVMSTVRYILPLSFIIFLVLGVIFIGVATPSEAAALGVIGTFILAAAYRQLGWEVVKKSFVGTIQITAMVLMIMTGARAFSQIMSYTGAGQGLIEAFIGLSLTPIFVVVLMQVVILLMGMFMDVVSIMMITLPLFMPVILALGFNPVWFGAMFLLNIEMATTSPPFGLVLFVMKGAAPPDTTMGDIYRAAIPFLLLDLIVMILMLAFPGLVLWLPGLMRG